MISIILTLVAAMIVPLVYGLLFLEHIRQLVVELGGMFGPLPTGACIVGYFALLDMLIHDRDRGFYLSLVE